MWGISGRIWRRFLQWLMEPIEFPGRWDASAPPSKTYNRESEPREN